MGTLNVHPLGVVTNSEERVSISPGGNLGIGTTNPLQSFHIQGSACVSENLT